MQSSKPASGMAQVSSHLGNSRFSFSPVYSCPQDPRTNGVGTGPAFWERAELGLWVAVTLEDRLREGGPAGGGEGPERAQWMAK